MSGWIDAKKKKPPKEEQVLAIKFDGVYQEHLLASWTLDGWEDSDGAPIGNDEDEGSAEITYWQPLPEPPEAE